MRLSRRLDWLVVERMEPSGSHTDELGRHWADFTMTYRKRWFWFLHPGYWVTFVRANVRGARR